MRLANRALGQLEKRASKRLREKAIRHLMGHIRYEDEATHFICIGPVNQLFNTLVWHFEKPGGDELALHKRRMPEYLWRAKDGVKMQGYNSSELWDTAFAAQAMLATGQLEKRKAMLTRAWAFLEQNQILEDPPELAKHYRHTGKGGWPFSTREHGWPITDCTAEGLKASLSLEPLGLPGTPVTPERQREAAELLLTWQNADGGWATYELTRGPKWLEQLNPSDVFADIMIDHCYVECTSACVQALERVHGALPGVGDCGHARGGEARRRVHPRDPARRRQLGGLVGRVLHLRDVVRRQRTARGARVPGWEAAVGEGGRVPGGAPAAGRRVGGDAAELPSAALRARQGRTGGDDVLGAAGAGEGGPRRTARRCSAASPTCRRGRGRTGPGRRSTSPASSTRRARFTTMRT